MISPTTRIHISKEHRSIYEQLAKRGNDNPENHPFPTMKDLFMTAAVIGMKEGKHKKVSGPEAIFSASVFDDKNDIPILASIAFAHNNDFSTLFNENEIIKIAEEYANGGILILRRELIEKSGRVMNNLMNYLLL